MACEQGKHDFYKKTKKRNPHRHVPKVINILLKKVKKTKKRKILILFGVLRTKNGGHFLYFCGFSTQKIAIASIV